MSTSQLNLPTGVPTYPGDKFTAILHHDTYPAINPANATVSGKVVAITGASQGIGRGMAVTFAQAGVSGLVLMAPSLTDLRVVENECRAAAPKGSDLNIVSASVDVKIYEQAAQAAEQARETFGRVDVLINNAGVLEDFMQRMTEMDPVMWWNTWEVHVQGTYHVSRAFLPLMIECGGQRMVINVSSVSAHFAAPTVSAYTNSKFALHRMTEIMQEEYGPDGVIVVVIHPGEVPTGMNDKLPEQLQFFICDKLDLGTHFTVWLASERRDWMAGRFISCNWDVEELITRRQEIVDGDKLKMRMVV